MFVRQIYSYDNYYRQKINKLFALDEPFQVTTL